MNLVSHSALDYAKKKGKLATGIPTMHGTLQQSFWRLIKEFIKVFADDRFPTDARNRSSHLEAIEMMKYLNEHGSAIPMI